MLKELIWQLHKLMFRMGDWLHRVRGESLPYTSNGLARRIALALQENAHAGVIYLDIVRFQLVERATSNSSAWLILKQLEARLKRIVSLHLSSQRVLAVQNLGEGDFCVCLVCSGEDPLKCLHHCATLVQNKLQEELKPLSLGLTCELELSGGYALLSPEQGVAPEEALYAALKEAKYVARCQPGLEKVRLTEQLKEIIRTRDFQIVFQPIVSLISGEVFGYEALTRFRPELPFKSPLHVFNFAAEVGFLYSLERVTREAALHHLGRFPFGIKLFLNINPRWSWPAWPTPLPVCPATS